jgi:hypothetical protein
VPLLSFSKFRSAASELPPFTGDMEESVGSDIGSLPVPDVAKFGI